MKVLSAIQKRLTKIEKWVERTNVALSGGSTRRRRRGKSKTRRSKPTSKPTPTKAKSKPKAKRSLKNVPPAKDGE